MTSTRPLVALISATPAAISPATSGLTRQFPEATAWNILDDRLLKDADAQGGVTPPLEERMGRLIEHALLEGADAVLLTCSLYGPVARAHVGSGAPVIAADDAAFDTVISGGFPRVLMLASFDAALEDGRRRFVQAAADAGTSPEVTGTVAAGAFDAALTGDDETVLAALDEACRPFVGQVDVVLLAQYSLASVAEQLSQRLGVPVVAGPDSAARALRSRIAPEGAQP